MLDTVTGRLGDWIQTASGGSFFPLDPRPEEVDIDDIATALSRMNRYNGHFSDKFDFYSVAEHSILLAQYVQERTGSATHAMWALLHDAAEAYTSDVPRPLKRQIAM